MRRMYSQNELEKLVKDVFLADVESGEIDLPALFEDVDLKCKSVEVDNSIKYLSKIVDENGHNRFIEGDITIPELTGFTNVYSKWSLSGSHLLIVVALSGTNASVLASGKLCEISLPAWIKDKIYPIYSVEVAQATSYWYTTGGSTQTMTTYLEKTSGNVIQIYTSGVTLNNDRNVRIAFDLLIDNE